MNTNAKLSNQNFGIQGVAFHSYYMRERERASERESERERERERERDLPSLPPAFSMFLKIPFTKYINYDFLRKLRQFCWLAKLHPYASFSRRIFSKRGWSLVVGIKSEPLIVSILLLFIKSQGMYALLLNDLISITRIRSLYRSLFYLKLDWSGFVDTLIEVEETTSVGKAGSSSKFSRKSDTC